MVIGLFGIATTFAALATTRQGEFGMLRHLGFTRGEIGRLIATEGALTAGLGVIAGLRRRRGDRLGADRDHQPPELPLEHGAGGALGGLAIFAAVPGAAGGAGGPARRAACDAASAVLAVKADW